MRLAEFERRITDAAEALQQCAQKIKGDGEYEDESAEPKDEATTKTVALAFLNPKDDCSPAAQYAPQKMTKAQFLEACAKFFDARGTHLNDFELMQVRINC